MSEPTEKKHRILVVDDHPLFCEGLRQMIERDPDLQVCGEAPTEEEAMKAVPRLRPDLVIVDISLGTGSGIDLVKEIKAGYPSIPILVISMHEEEVYAERALRAGALGYVMKQEPGRVVKAAIRKALSGQVHMSERMSSSLIGKLLRAGGVPETPIQTLSDRELDVFRLLGEGKATREIAERLGVTQTTVNSFRARIKEKLGVANAEEVKTYAAHWLERGTGGPQG